MERCVMYCIGALDWCIVCVHCVVHCVGALHWCTASATLVRKRDEWSVSLLVSRKCPPE